MELGTVIELKKDTGTSQSYLIMEIFTVISVLRRDKQEANRSNSYLSPRLGHHNEKAEEQHSLSKHDLEPYKRKGQMQGSEDQNN